MLEQGDDKQENFRNAVGVHCRFRCLLTALAQRYRKIGETRRPDIFFGLWVTLRLPHDASRSVRLAVPMTRAVARSSATDLISRRTATGHPAGMVDAAMSVPPRRTR